MGDFIDYPVDQVFAVFDSSEAADGAAEALRRADVPDDDVQRFGKEDADRFDWSGEQHGLAARALRGIQFGLTDELQPLAWYEAGLREGRAVIAVHTSDRETTLRIVKALQEAGGYFIYSFGKLASEEFSPWRGPEPPVANVMRQ